MVINKKYSRSHKTGIRLGWSGVSLRTSSSQVVTIFRNSSFAVSYIRAKLPFASDHACPRKKKKYYFRYSCGNLQWSVNSFKDKSCLKRSVGFFEKKLLETIFSQCSFLILPFPPGNIKESLAFIRKKWINMLSCR